MSVEATYTDIQEAYPAARGLRQQTPPDAEWVKRLGKITRAVHLAARQVDDDLSALQERFGEQTEDGGLIIKPERLTAYNKELRRLMGTKITLDCDPIHKSELDAAKIRFPTALDFLILED